MKDQTGYKGRQESHSMLGVKPRLEAISYYLELNKGYICSVDWKKSMEWERQKMDTKGNMKKQQKFVFN